MSTKEELKAIAEDKLNPLKADANKYSAGSLVCFSGSFGMAGAALLSAKAALRSGSGMVRAVLPKSIYPVCAAALWEAVYTPCEDDENGRIASSVADDVKELISKANAVVFGCGVGAGKGAKAVLEKLLTDNTLPLLIDADGINILAKHIDMLRRKSCSVVLTPHEGEMSRLTGLSPELIRNNRVEVAKSFAAEYGVTLLLKGKDTVVAGECGQLIINPTGNCGLATAGSGDVLSGIIGALLSQSTEPFYAAVLGAYIHGLSGDLAAEKLGHRSLVATDIIEYLPKAFKEC